MKILVEGGTSHPGIKARFRFASSAMVYNLRREIFENKSFKKSFVRSRATIFRLSCVQGCLCPYYRAF